MRLFTLGLLLAGSLAVPVYADQCVGSAVNGRCLDRETEGDPGCRI